MKTPLALIQVSYHTSRGQNLRPWMVIKTTAAACGHRAHKIVYLRKPTTEEREAMRPCLDREGKVYELEDLMDKAWRYEQLQH